jgi:hypothetical protein
MVVVEAKERLYHDRHPTNMFLLLANRGFWVLTLTSGQFFHQCASMVQLAKGIGDPPLGVLCAFYRQRIALQRTQGASILKHISLKVRVLLSLLCFQVSHPFPSPIWFLQLVGALEHNCSFTLF